jgi:hypothetical protein
MKKSKFNYGKLLCEKEECKNEAVIMLFYKTFKHEPLFCCEACAELIDPEKSQGFYYITNARPEIKVIH